MGSFSERAIANRRCSERRKVIGRLQASRKVPKQSRADGPQGFESKAAPGTRRTPAGSAGRKTQADPPERCGAAHWNRQVEGKASLKSIRPPDGTARRCKCAGQWLQLRREPQGARQARQPDNRPVIAQWFTPEQVRPDARSITMPSTPVPSARAALDEHHSGQVERQAGSMQPPIGRMRRRR